MKSLTNIFLLLLSITMIVLSCIHRPAKEDGAADKSAAEILGNSDYPAICFGGYRHVTRDIQPTVPELKEDLRILEALGIKVIRTYNVYLDETSNLLKAIRELQSETPGFEMYMMLGAWIDCKNARTDSVDHNRESPRNAGEIKRAVALAKRYPDIVKVIAVGNEAMVKWAESYYVQPGVILKWVNHLQELKRKGELPASLWITSSDNFASWGGGGAEYHTKDLDDLIRNVDFISMHTYPMHDTHYNPDFWRTGDEEGNRSEAERIDAAMLRAKQYAIAQYESVVKYMKSLGVNKPVHIGETGWASSSDGFYGNDGSRACDEYKSALYYQHITSWARDAGVSCFWFEAFDEPWKDAQNPAGSENHFGLINLQSQAKFALWDHVDNGTFEGLTRNGQPITKTFGGDKGALMQTVMAPPFAVKPDTPKSRQ
jgi:exo-beta-1,3-glucanase (GH17 family)